MIFSRFASPGTRSGMLALALATATGATLAAVAIEAPASAQKKKKEKKEKADYSQGFIAAYSPLEGQVKAGADTTILTAGVPGVVAAVETDDDRMAGGNLIYTIGQKAADQAIQLQGVEMMIASGKVPFDAVGQYSFMAGQLAYSQKDYAKARGYVQQAFNLGYTRNDPQAIIAETYFAEDNYADGLRFLKSAIDAKKAAGQTVEEGWIKRGLAIAYQNSLVPQAREFSILYIRDYPSEASWGDAIAIALNTNKFEYPEILDLLRLARRAGTMRDSSMYMEYIEAADARRNPAEVIAVIDEGYADGKLDRSDNFVADSRAQAAGRLDADKRDLPALANDARAAGAGVRTVMAAGDAYLSYGRGAEAEEFYTKALTMPGVNRPLTLTRLGIAQLDQGKFSSASESFGKVEGERAKIADLFAAWADQNAGSGTSSATVEAAAEPVGS